jgi:metal-responsive CopG/Arc/MetJ family transcriptional regulator
MKTAISLPDSLYNEAEITAKQLGLARSQLYARAIEEFVERHNRDKITEKLNSLYSNEESGEEQLAEAGIESLRENTKHDSW